MKDERQLIDRYVDGDLTLEEERRLAGWLTADGEHIREFVRETHLHRQLREAILARPFQDEARTAVQQARRKSSPLPARSLARWLAQRFDFPSVLRRAWLPLAAGLMLIAGAGAWFFGAPRGEPVLAEVQGAGFSLERTGQPLPASLGMRLQSGDVLHTPDNVTAAISFAPENTRHHDQPGTELKLAERSRGKRFALRVGKLEASVARQRPFRAMVIVTPQAEARVLGTKFTLAVTTNSTSLEVTEGKVRLTRVSDGKAVKVTAGHYAVAATNSELTALPATGRILREYWTNYPGTFEAAMSSDSTISDHPQGWDYITRFETPPNVATRSGERVHGYVHPPTTGEYRFSIANTGRGSSFLFLSPDDKRENRVHIAEFATTARSSASGVPRNRSGLISLVAGRKYYIESLHEADASDGQLTVDWQRPGRDHEIIPGEFLHFIS